jgi:hypothetical protein
MSGQIAALLTGLSFLCSPLVFASGPGPAQAHGLQEVEASSFRTLSLLPDTSFRHYQSIVLSPMTVEFDRSWLTNQKLADPFRLKPADLDKISRELEEEYRTIFAEALNVGGYSVVDTATENTLLLNTQVSNFQLNNPVNNQPYSITVLAETALRMNIMFELVDAQSNVTLMQASDRGRSRDYMEFRRQSVVQNRSEIRRLLKRWSLRLVATLNEQRPL